MPQGTISGYEGRKRTILLVDDKWENRSVIFNLLEPIGFEMMEASNGKEGIERAVATIPDLIITDLLMPVMDGFTLIEQVKQSAQLKDVPMIASSASVFDSDRNQCLDAGANAFLPKPVVAETLLALLQVQLNLTWVYTAESKTETTQPKTNDISLPPINVLNRLYELVKHGDVDGVVNEANNLKASDPAYFTFAQQVIQLAENFQLKKLRELLTSSPSS